MEGNIAVTWIRHGVLAIIKAAFANIWANSPSLNWCNDF